MKYCVVIALLHVVFGVKIKVMHSDEDDSKVSDDEDIYPITKMIDVTLMPFVKKHHKHVEENDEDDKVTEKSHLHPNDLFFPLIYKQSHINSMFKFGDTWYTWSVDERKDGAKVNYYACYDEPKHCDETGWDRVESVPRCAFQIDSLMGDDRACVNTFGVEPRNNGNCDTGEPIKVNDMMKSCGATIRSLWRFVRASRRPPSATKPADINTLVCEEEQECYITIEYKIHHDRITFSLTEPTRGQTYKSALIRDVPLQDEKITPIPGHRHPHVVKKLYKESYPRPNKKYHKKHAEGKGVMKEHNDGYPKVNEHKNKIKVREDVYSDEGTF